MLHGCPGLGTRWRNTPKPLSSTRTKGVHLSRYHLAWQTPASGNQHSAPGWQLLCPLVSVNGLTRVGLLRSTARSALSANQLPGDLRRMATVEGLQPVTFLSTAHRHPMDVHQGPSAYSSCSPSLKYWRAHPAPHHWDTPIPLATALHDRSSVCIRQQTVGGIIPDFHRSVKWV
jgi:hypothetical protein